MVRRVIIALIVVGALALVYVGYKNWSFKRAMLSGEVTGGSNEPATAENRTSPLNTDRGANQPQPERSPQAGMTAPKQAATIPDGDTISPQPPNGTVFAGTGHFQIYRQGNLTWRINTDTGRTCILFATNEEWRKPRVYQHGCGSSAAQ